MKFCIDLVIKCVSSSWGNIISGVPQGSVLVPLLFLFISLILILICFQRFVNLLMTQNSRAVATEDEVQLLRDDLKN